MDDNCIEQIDSYCGLFDRKKGEKLSNKQLNFLKQQWNELKLTPKQLSSKYFVSQALSLKLRECRTIKSIMKIQDNMKSYIKRQRRSCYAD